jgi:2'-5' RNA ligase
VGTGQVEGAAKIRAFVAVRVGDEVEAALAGFIDEVRLADDGIAWMRRENLHVTLKFLGAGIDSAKLPALEEGLNRIANNTSALHVCTRGIGGFPDLRRPRILWTGLECDALAVLATRIEDAAVAAGFDRVERPWAPHLTIGRVRDPRKAKKVREWLESSRDREFGESQVSEVSVYRSRLSSKGSSYERLAAFRLQSS